MRSAARTVLDFIGVAAPRCGTTWLADALGEHPQIFVPPLKELNFFGALPFGQIENRFERGISFYERQFQRAPPDALIGEFTPTYYCDPKAAPRIHSFYPHVRILVMLRNPAEMLYSLYFKRREFEPVTCSFEEMLEEDENFLSVGFYNRNLAPYFDIFPRERIYVGIFERFFETLDRSFADLLGFLGVDKSFVPEGMGEKRNPRRSIRWPLVVKIRHHLRRAVNHKWLLPLKRAVARTNLLDHLDRKLVTMNLADSPLPRLNPDTRRQVVQVFEEDRKRLEELLEMDLGFWDLPRGE